MLYKAVLHRTEEGISVSVPELPGCRSEGDTEEEALEDIPDAIRERLAALNGQTRDAEIWSRDKARASHRPRRHPRPAALQLKEPALVAIVGSRRQADGQSQGPDRDQLLLVGKPGEPR